MTNKLVVTIDVVDEQRNSVLHVTVAAIDHFQEQLECLVREISFNVCGVRANGGEHHLSNAAPQKLALSSHVLRVVIATFAQMSTKDSKDSNASCLIFVEIVLLIVKKKKARVRVRK